MSKTDWKRKLSSRKFWAAIVSFVTAMCAAFGAGDGTTAQITLIITGIGALAVYMLAEGIADRGGGIAEGIEIEEEIVYESTDIDK